MRQEKNARRMWKSGARRRPDGRTNHTTSRPRLEARRPRRVGARVERRRVAVRRLGGGHGPHGGGGPHEGARWPDVALHGRQDRPRRVRPGGVLVGQAKPRGLSPPHGPAAPAGGQGQPALAAVDGVPVRRAGRGSPSRAESWTASSATTTCGRCWRATW